MSSTINESSTIFSLLVNDPLPKNTFEGIETAEEGGLAGKVLISVVLGSVLTLIFAGNLTVLCLMVRNYRKQKYMRNSGGLDSKLRRTNFFIVNLAIIDLLLSLIILPPNIIQIIKEKWFFGNTFCKVSR